jgi:hypothetical protein
MATSSMSNNALLLHGRDDHAPLFALSRGSALVPPKVGMARRRRPIFAATPPSHPETALPRLKFGAPTARRPYHFFTKAAVAPTPARQRALKTYNLKP